MYISVSAFLLGSFMALSCTAGPVSTGSFSLVLGVRKSIKGRVVPMSWLSTCGVHKADNQTEQVTTRSATDALRI